MNIKKTILTTAVISTLALSAKLSHAASDFISFPVAYNNGNFTLLDTYGATVPGSYSGTNDVAMYWNGTAYNSNADYTGLTSVANVTLSSNQPLFAPLWTAHNIQMFSPGSYTFNTALDGGTPESGILNLNVGPGQLGMHMLFDWNGNNNIDIVVLLKTNGPAVFGSGIGSYEDATFCSAPGSNCLWNSGPPSSFENNNIANRPAGSQLWMFTSIDGNGDGVPGIPMMAGGPFNTFSANFNFAPVPVPSALWLFGSGLTGLLGFIRQRKNLRTTIADAEAGIHTQSCLGLLGRPWTSA